MKWVSLILTMGACVVNSMGSKAMPSDLSNEEVLEALWRSPKDCAPLLADPFLAEISIAQIEAIVEDLKTRCGALEDVQGLPKENHYKIRSEQCEMTSRLHRDDHGKIIGLWLDTPIRRDVALSKLLEETASFDGDISYAVYKNDELVAGRETDRPLAVGSAFKLVVLAELDALIERGEATWSDVITLKSKHVSLPSGSLQKMPLGSPFTLHTLAAAMIAESDNTATDVLIDYIGRDRLEQISNIKPFLTTREVFQLKADPELYGRYASSDLEDRHDILRSLEALSLPGAGKVARLWQEQAEWLMSAESLCSWVKKVAHLEITQIDPGVLARSDWQKIAYKGGSEDGVLNLTTFAWDDRNQTYCVSMTWNADHQLDDRPLAELYGSVFAALARD